MIRSVAGCLHGVLDEDELHRVYAAANVEPRLRGLVTGPFDLWSLQQLRAAAAFRSAQRLATDVFVWAAGEAPDRTLTKLGGLPCLPRRHRWPVRDGCVGTFYAQLNCRDSRDLVPFAPAPVLLVFKYFASGLNSWTRELHEFVWVEPERMGELYQPGDVPDGGLHADPALFGVRVRTWDAPDLTERVRRQSLDHFHIVSGTKVGGCPADAQSIDRPGVPSSWRFLGQITATFPAVGVPYPALLHPAPVELRDAGYERLMHGPGDGILCLFLDEHGAVQIHFSCG